MNHQASKVESEKRRAEKDEKGMASKKGMESNKKGIGKDKKSKVTEEQNTTTTGKDKKSNSKHVLSRPQ